MPKVDPTLMNRVNLTAEEFSRALQELAGFYEENFAIVVRKTVFDLFANIIRRSPVDTGSYRASHGIATHEPGPTEGIRIIENKTDVNVMTAIAEYGGWTWKPGDGDIYIFNNLPYAEPLENGHSGQAPEGIYRQAMTELEAVMKKQISRLRVGGIFI